MTRKYLEEIGCNEYPENGYGDKRTLNKFKREKRKTGVMRNETWDLDSNAIRWIYERLIVYKQETANKVDLEWHTVSFEGTQYTVGQLINTMIELAEYIVMNLDNVKPNTEAYNRLVNNKYFTQFNEPYDEFNGQHFQLEQQFWNIWAKIFPFMWW